MYYIFNARLADVFAQAVHSPGIKTKLVALGLYPVGRCGTEFATYLRKRYKEYGLIIRESRTGQNEVP